MAGSINLSLSQQFDITNGRLLSGGKLYFFSPGTTTPQNAFRDSGLTLPHPNPITLASDGRVPQLYFADGSIHCRLLNKDGISQFDVDNILVIGPSSGGGGGGGVTDPNAIYQTGDVMWLDVGGTRPGWVRDNGRTLGSATSGASERANADAQALFIYLWTTFTFPSSNSFCPVIGGFGASALADWGANKQITLPDKRGFVPGGLPDMGNSDSGAYVGVPVNHGTITTPGASVGESRHTNTIAEMPSHDHGGNAPLGSFTGNTAALAIGGNQRIQLSNTNGGDLSTNFSTVGNTGATITAQGGGGAHNTTQLTVLGTFYRKL